jgi:hypothetical protein
MSYSYYCLESKTQRVKGLPVNIHYILKKITIYLWYRVEDDLLNVDLVLEEKVNNELFYDNKQVFTKVPMLLDVPHPDFSWLRILGPSTLS